ncbi:MAG: phosphodiester glycosidase family protein [Herpetosiphon sp.]
MRSRVLGSNWLVVAGLLLMVLVGCAAGGGEVVGQREPGTSGSTPAAQPEPDETAWQTVGDGMQYRRMLLQAEGRTGRIVGIRLDPARYKIRVAYDRLHPGSIHEWATAIKPVAMINGGYFDAQYKATALVIIDGIVSGASYDGFGGMVVVNPQGRFELRSLRKQPFDAAEPLQQAMQSTPMLIQPGGVVADIKMDQVRARRTVVARDRTGRILLMVSDWADFSLWELAVGLKGSDLDLDAALNLDGGRSSGLYLQTSTKQVVIEAFDQLPLMLVVDRPR